MTVSKREAAIAAVVDAWVSEAPRQEKHRNRLRLPDPDGMPDLAAALDGLVAIERPAPTPPPKRSRRRSAK